MTRGARGLVALETRYPSILPLRDAQNINDVATVKYN
jgi:hypothetical protein